MTEAYAHPMSTTVYANDGGYGYFEIDMSKANIADWLGFPRGRRSSMQTAC
jgi:hypothetical protein